MGDLDSLRLCTGCLHRSWDTVLGSTLSNSKGLMVQARQTARSGGVFQGSAKSRDKRRFLEDSRRWEGSVPFAWVRQAGCLFRSCRTMLQPEKQPPPALGPAGGALCAPLSSSPGWVSGALAHSHADHVCHHGGLFIFLNLLVSVLSQCFG